MFGGTSGNGTHPSEYNDLWCYCILTNQWIWVQGDNTTNAAGNWGALGISSPANKPNGRGGTIGWTDNNSHLFLFGGWDQYNDLWRYTIDYSCINCSQTLHANFAANNFICPGACTGFINLSTNATSYQWSFPGGSPGTSTAMNPSPICYSTSGTFDVQLISSNASGSDTLLISNCITVYPYPPPQAIAQNGDTLTANAGAVSYQWFLNGNIISGATNYFYVALSSGDYNVVVTDTNGCEVEAVIFNVIAGTHSPDSYPDVYSELISVYPNPVSDNLTIEKKQPGNVAIAVYNMLSERIYSADDCKLSPDGHYEVDCRLLSPGVYWLEVSSNENVFRTKFIKSTYR